MKSISLSVRSALLIGAIGIGCTGCGGPVGAGSVDSEVPREKPEVVKSNLEGGLFFMGQWYDVTGDVHVAVWSSDYVNGYHNTAECAVPSGWVLIGGGADIESSNTNALLHASYPDGVNQKWIVKSKDHGYTDYHGLSAWCIGLQLNGLSFTDLRAQTHYTNPVTSSAGHWPWVGADLPSGYVLVGGGARANWTGPGLLLTESSGSVYGPPDYGGTWYAAAKDHVYAEVGTVSAYAIGIARCPVGWGGKCLTASTVSVSGSPDGGGMQWVSASATSDWALTNVGARSWSSDAGRPLTDMFTWSGSFSRGGIHVATKDHIIPDSGHAIGYLTGIRRN